jgi:hypothetical protein
MKFLLSLLTGVFFAFISNRAFAAPDGTVPSFMKGWTYAQVMKEFGPPEAKDTMEIRREEVWSYSKQKVVFKEGRVAKFYDLSPKDMASLAAKKKKRVQPASEMDLILKDLVSKP